MSLKSQLEGLDSAEASILLSDLRQAVGDDLETLRKFTVSRYRDDYLQADSYAGKPRRVLVHRERLIAALCEVKVVRRKVADIAGALNAMDAAVEREKQQTDPAPEAAPQQAEKASDHVVNLVVEEVATAATSKRKKKS